MNKSSLYFKVHPVTLDGSQTMLDKYFHLIPQDINEKKKLLDIGSGPGNITCSLLPLFKGSIEKAIGIDISTEMVNFANSSFGNSVLSFEVLDVQYNAPIKYLNYFDYVFSFWTLHWIKDQRKLYTNIFEMMKPKGTIFVTCVAYSKFYNIYKKIWKNKKYSSYIRDDAEKSHSCFQNWENPKDDLEKILNDVGFQVEMCKIENVVTIGEKSVMKDFLRSINLVYDEIPGHLQEEFIEDHLSEIDQDTDGKYKIDYELFVICAMKN
ncbi:hypothetical protein FQA39_LY01636 [Lamprigera yunnana]|nr:hypothetical protein FQA39_LY01636 [Lamprigera yunnana]